MCDDFCEHENINQGICVSCGTFMREGGCEFDMNENFSNSHIRLKKIKDIGFFRDLNSKKCIHPEVKQWIHDQVSETPNFKKNIKNKDQTLFAYVYKGYVVLGIDINPIKLAEDLDISRKDATIGSKIASEIGTRSLPQSINPNANVKITLDVRFSTIYIEEELKKINRLDLLKSVVKLSERILAVDENLNILENFPSKIAMGFIDFYIKKKEIEIYKIHINFKVSAKELKTYYDMISNGYDIMKNKSK